jgi:hypothetical protein
MPSIISGWNFISSPELLEWRERERREEGGRQDLDCRVGNPGGSTWSASLKSLRLLTDFHPMGASPEGLRVCRRE